MSDYFYVDREEFECVQNVALGSYGIFTQDSSGNLLYGGKYIYYEGNLVPGVTDAGLPNHYYTTVDVAGTSWEFDSAPTALTSSAVFNFNFKTNSANYTKLTVIVNGSTVTVKYDDTVCYQNGWTNGTYRNIRVIDGTDASNWQLAAFLIDNAVSITNGTKNISGNISVDGDFNVNGVIKKNGNALISGTKLYKHVLSFDVAENNEIEIISTDSTALTEYDLRANQTGTNRLAYCLSCKIMYRASSSQPMTPFNVVGISYNDVTENFLFSYFNFGQSNAQSSDAVQTTQLFKYAKSKFIGDTVTEL